MNLHIKRQHNITISDTHQGNLNRKLNHKIDHHTSTGILHRIIDRTVRLESTEILISFDKNALIEDKYKTITIHRIGAANAHLIPQAGKIIVRQELMV